MSPTIPSRPASGFDRTAFELVFNDLTREVGDVISNDDARAFAQRHGIHFTYVQDILGLFAQVGLVWQPRDGYWYVVANRERAAGETEQAHRRRLEIVDAYLLSRISGCWGHVAGAWALRLDGTNPMHGNGIPGVPFCIVTKTAHFATERFATRSGTYQASVEITPRGPDAGNRARHLMAGCGATCAVATRRADRLRPVTYLSAGGAGVHVQQPAHAVVTMFEYPRLSGGYAAYRDVVLHAVLRLGYESICRAAGGATLTVRRRLAFGLWDVATRIDRTTWCSDPSDRAVAWPISELRWWIAHELDVCGGASQTLLDPHRRPCGPLNRVLGVLDNRAAAPTVRTYPRFDPEAFGTWLPPSGRIAEWEQM